MIVGGDIVDSLDPELPHLLTPARDYLFFLFFYVQCDVLSSFTHSLFFFVLTGIETIYRNMPWWIAVLW